MWIEFSCPISLNVSQSLELLNMSNVFLKVISSDSSWSRNLLLSGDFKELLYN